MPANNVEKLTKFRFLGKLCSKPGHEYEGSGQSLRYKSTRKCVRCSREHSKEWQEKHPERYKSLKDQWYKSHKDHHLDWHRKYLSDTFRRHYTRCQARSSRDNIPFNLTADFLKDLWEKQEGKCHWLGIQMDFDSPNYHVYKATIDRLVPEKGYTQGNIVWASRFANIGRGNTPADEFKVFLENLGVAN